MPNRFVPIWLVGLLLCGGASVSLRGQCTFSETTPQGFTFCYAGDSVRVAGPDCTAPLDLIEDNPFNALVTVQTPPNGSVNFFNLSEALTGYGEDDPVPAGTLLDVFYVMNGQVNGSGVVDTFRFTLRFTDLTGPDFPGIPGDTTVACPNEVPPAPPLDAVDACDGTVFAGVQPSTISSINNACATGEVRYRYTAVDNSGNTGEREWVITVAPDNQPPEFAGTLSDTTERCETADYPTWLAATHQFFAANTTDNCGVDTVFNDGPAVFGDSCGALLITFRAEDACGNATERSVTYTRTDDTAPVFANLPPTPDTIVAGDPLPPVDTLQVSDNCTVSPVVTLLQSSTQGDGGPCSDYTYTVDRTYNATDECGNITQFVRVLRIIDIAGPTFVLPADTLIGCAAPTDTASLGSPTQLVDAADPAPVLTFTDELTGTACERAIIRSWIAVDACGNETRRNQLINIRDTVPPSFVVPADRTVSCELVNDSTVTGIPAQVMDNCTLQPAVSIANDAITPGNCPNNYTILRTWRVVDACGNATEQNQLLTVRDTTPPLVMSVPLDRTLTCSDTLDAEAAFQQWLSDNGGAVLADNCQSALTWVYFNTGTSDFASLPPAACPSAQFGTVRRRTVDFIVSDGCSNTRSFSATFRVVDNEAPTFLACVPDTTLVADAGCAATYTLPVPAVRDNCGGADSLVQRTTNAQLTSPVGPTDPANAFTPVDTVRLTLQVPAGPTAPRTDGQLTITLENADAEDPNEHFRVYAEDGALLGQTAPVAAQCADGSTTFVLSRAQLASYALDGELGLILAPNVPAALPGTFAINRVCGTTTVGAQLTYTARVNDALRYSYRVEGGPEQFVSPAAPVGLTLEGGAHRVTSIFTDCAGRRDSCQHTVTVVDRTAPVLACPADLTVAVPTDSCAVTTTLPLPVDLTDNCATGAGRQLDSGPQALNFSFDPNLNLYVADTKTLALGGAVADALVTPVTLTFRWRADSEAPDEFFRVLDENNEPLFATPPGGCGQVASTTFGVSAERFNGWAADGIVVFSVEANAGLPGSTDGINPCNPGAVMTDGDDDAISFVRLTVDYAAATLTYAVSGPSPLGPTLVIAAPRPTLAQGSHTVTYVATDAAGNTGSCSFGVLVRDTTPPGAICTPSFVSINPAGAALTPIDPSVIDGGSTDNCGIDTAFVSPAVINCDQVGDTVAVTLTVVDAAGNSASCNTFIAVQGIAPQPSFTVDCEAATLQLFANPPPALGTAFQYAWTGPNGFQDNQRDPLISAATEAEAGFYTVVITGVTGCTGTGTVQVAAADLPPAPPLLRAVRDSVCAGEAFRFEIDNAQPGDSYTLRNAQGDSITSSTQLPLVVPSAGLAEGEYCYTATTTRNNCTSAPSGQRCVYLTAVGDAVLAEDELIRCSGQQVVLEAVLPVEMGTTYRWVGPNFTQDGPQTQAVVNNLQLADDGNYLLTAVRNGCVSASDTAVIFVLETPAKPTLFSSTTPANPACEGETVTLSTNPAGGAAQYTWQQDGSTSFSTQVPELVLPDAAQALSGLWTVRITAANGCASPVSDPVQVFVAPRPLPAATADPMMICNGDDLQLFATSSPAAISYRWTGPDGFVSVQQNPVLNDLTNAAQGVYQVVVTTAAGCQDSTSVAVGSNSSIEVTGISDDASACPSGPETVTLNATVFPQDDQNNYGYRWTRNGDLLGTDAELVIPNATPANNGTYQLVVVSADGCASDPFPYTLALGEPVPTPAQPQVDAGATPCTGADLLLIVPNANYSGNVTYLWETPGDGTISTDNPSLPLPDLGMDDAGNYTVRVSVNGCVSPVSAPLPLDVAAPPGATASSNAPVCSGATLVLSVVPQPGATYNWSGPDNFTATVAQPQIANADPALHQGTYSVTVINSAGCESAPATINVLVVPTPPTPVLSGPVAVCGSNDSLRFSVATNPPGSSYEWRANGSPIALGPDSFLVVPNVYPDGAMPTFRVLRFVNDCSSAPSNAVTVAINTVPNNSAAAGPDQTVCTTSTQLNATAPSTGTGSWTQTGGPAGAVIANPDAAQTPVNNLVPEATYTFAWSLSNGSCEDYSTDEVRIFAVAANSIDGGPNIDTCGVDAVTLQGQLPAVGVGTWTQPAVQELLDVFIADPNDPQTEVGNFEAGGTYFFFYATDSDCGEVRDTVRVFIRADRADAGADIDDCGDGCVPLAANLEFSENGRWLSPDDDLVFDDPTDPMTTVCQLRVGENTLIWELNGGRCGANSYDTLTVLYRLAAEAVDDSFTLALGTTVEFNVLDNDDFTGAVTVTVVEAPLAGTLRDEGEGNFSYAAPTAEAGVFTFRYELCGTGCACTEATVSFFIEAAATCVPPTLITPNGDGINDVFLIECLLNVADFPDNRLTVYNEWGGVVYQAAPYPNDWRGTYRGDRLPPGTYFYVFEPGGGRAAISNFLVIQ